MSLNLHEATDWAKCQLNGAWCVDEQSNLVFTSFFPMAGFRDWELGNLTLSCGMRSRWAGKVLAEDEADHPRGANEMLH
jgi:hypothetical protein